MAKLNRFMGNYQQARNKGELPQIKGYLQNMYDKYNTLQ